MSENENLDRPLWGAEEIGREAGLIDKNGITRSAGISSYNREVLHVV